jgi:hypothetical protein
MLEFIIGLDAAKIAEEGKYSALRLVVNLHKLCLNSGFYCFDNDIYTLIKETRDEEYDCLFRLMNKLVANPPLLEYLEYFVVKDGISSYIDFLEFMTTLKHEDSVRMEDKEVYPIRKSDVSRLVS